jgi:hypothetical protein
MHDFVWQVVKVCDFDVARLKPTPMSSSEKGRDLVKWQQRQELTAGCLLRYLFNGTPSLLGVTTHWWTVYYMGRMSLVMHLMVCCPTSNKWSVWVNHQFSGFPICVWNACWYDCERPWSTNYMITKWMFIHLALWCGMLLFYFLM